MYRGKGLTLCAFHPNCREKLNVARGLLGQQPYSPGVRVPSALEILRRMFPDRKVGLCPYCGSELRTVFKYRGGHATSVRIAA